MADQVEPAGESVHLPGPSYLPVIVAFGITLAVVGVVVQPLISLVGLLITIFAIVRWIRDTRRDIGELPLEH